MNIFLVFKRCCARVEFFYYFTLGCLSIMILLLWTTFAYANLSPSSTYDNLFKQAIAYDLAGKPALARKNYDELKKAGMSSKIAIPSAINFVSLGEYQSAQRAFDAAIQDVSKEEREYLYLWQLWLAARTFDGTQKNLKYVLSRMSQNMNASLPHHRAIIELYSGKGGAEAVFSSVSTMTGINNLQRRDALTEAVFFVGGYLQYVAHDKVGTQKLYERELDNLNSTSLESPLIKQSMETLFKSK